MLKKVEEKNLPTLYDSAQAALAKCVKMDECKVWVNKMAAMKVYAKQAGDREMEANAIEIRVRAERRLGQLLKVQRETVGFQGGPGIKLSPSKLKLNAPPSLADLGVAEVLSARSQKLAKVPEGKFEKAITEMREALDVGKQISAHMIRRLATSDQSKKQRKEAKTGQTQYNGKDVASAEFKQTLWQANLAELAGECIALEASWAHTYDDWESFEVTSDLAALVKQAAEAWKKLASDLNRRRK